MDWRYVKSIDEKTLEEVEKRFNIKISEKLKKLVLQYNSGRPEKSCFDTISEKGKELKKLLSYNKEDKDNIYSFSELIDKEFIPFAITEFGDILCEDKEKKIYLYQHELDKFDYVAENVEEFINLKLY